LASTLLKFHRNERRRLTKYACPVSEREKIIPLEVFHMDLVRNRASDMPFIVLDDAGDTYIQLITPEGKVKSLDRHLFDPLVPIGQTDSKQHNGLTPAQMDKYSEYMEYDDF